MREISSIVTPEQIYRRNIGSLVQLWKNGVMTDDCIAYSGTCLEALQHATKTGCFPGASTFSYILNPPEIPQLGDIYFNPRMKNFPFEKIQGRDIRYWENRDRNIDLSYEEAVLVAEDRSQGIRLLSILKLPYQLLNFHACDYVAEYTNKGPIFQDAKADLLSFGVKEKDLEKAQLLALKRKGIVIGLKDIAVDLFDVTEGDAGDDIRINVSHGLPLKYLSGIVALGEEENIFFENLSKLI